MKYDDLLKIIGEFGKYQKIQYVLVCIVTFTLSFHSMNMVFVGPTPEHRCLPGESPVEWKNHNFTQNQMQLLTFPFSEDGEIDQCYMYNMSEVNWKIGNYSEWRQANRTLLSCPHGWYYSTKYYNNTIVSEWNLVCEDAWKRSTVSSIFFGGRLAGALVAGQLSDIIGRRPVFFISLVLLTAVGCGAAFSPRVEVFYALYFLQGLLQVAVSLTSFVLGVELLGPHSRTFYVFTNKITDCLGQVSLAGIAYIIRDWRWIEFTISIVFIFYLSYFWFVPESVRWLMSKGRKIEAQNILLRAAKTNKVKLSNEVLDNIDIEVSAKTNYTALDLLRTWKSAKISVNLWLANAMVYYGLTINTSNMRVDPYANYFFSCIVEVPALVLALFLIDKIGRRKMLFAFMFTAGVACIVTAFIPPHLVWVSAGLSVIGKFGVSGSYALMYLLSAELFPTVVRNVGIGTSSMCARLGGIIAPALLFFGTYYRPLPLLAFGVFTLIGAGFGLLLPEVGSKPLAQNFDDIEEQTDEEKNKHNRFVDIKNEDL